jgi:hypothetical protein
MCGVSLIDWGLLTLIFQVVAMVCFVCKLFVLVWNYICETHNEWGLWMVILIVCLCQFSSVCVTYFNGAYYVIVFICSFDELCYVEPTLYIFIKFTMVNKLNKCLAIMWSILFTFINTIYSLYRTTSAVFSSSITTSGATCLQLVAA